MSSSTLHAEPTLVDGTPFTLPNVLKSIPAELLEADNKRAAVRLAAAVLFFLGTTLILTSNTVSWVLLPFLWILAGLAMTGLFAVAHDCGHYAFFKQRWLNTLVGGLCFLPLMYPLQGWRLHHNLHHDFESRETRALKPQVSKSFVRLINPIFWPYDMITLVLVYFDLSKFAPHQQRDSRLGVLASYAFGFIFFSAVIYNLGVWGFVKIWLAPWFVFHFWKNTLRRALPAVSFKYPNLETSRKYLEASQGAGAELRTYLTELTHYTFPRWFEFLCHDINYQIPHYLSTEIPSYNLRAAHCALLQSRWAEKISQYEFGWNLLQGTRAAQKMVHDTTVAVEEKVKTTTLADIKKFLGRLNWLHVPLFITTDSLALYGLLTVDYVHKTFVFAVFYYYYTGLGITAGYHRLWAHRAYDAAYPVRLALMLAGSGAVEGSLLWWCRDHRVHHRYCDTDKDPYNARRGFWYSHMGWMLIKEDWRRLGKVNVDDLNADPMIQLQHKYYGAFAIVMGALVPTLFCGLLWGDYYGGFFVAGIIRLCFVHHATFFVNSLAHYFGDQPFADRHTPKDSFLTAILTLGEGYHNFHHEFPRDYRNAIKFYQYDPTKWLIRVLAFFGLTYNLRTFPENEVNKGKVQMAVKEIQRQSQLIDWGDDIASLPEMTMEDVAAHKEDNWMVLGGLVLDCSAWADDHPGGAKLIQMFGGKDATNAFNGGVYNHSNAGRNMASHLRIGRIKGAAFHGHDPTGRLSLSGAAEAHHSHPEPLADDRYEIIFPQKVMDAKKSE